MIIQGGKYTGGVITWGRDYTGKGLHGEGTTREGTTREGNYTGKERHWEATILVVKELHGRKLHRERGLNGEDTT